MLKMTTLRRFLDATGYFKTISDEWGIDDSGGQERLADVITTSLLEFYGNRYTDETLDRVTDKLVDDPDLLSAVKSFAEIPDESYEKIVDYMESIMNLGEIYDMRHMGVPRNQLN